MGVQPIPLSSRRQIYRHVSSSWAAMAADAAVDLYLCPVAAVCSSEIAHLRYGPAPLHLFPRTSGSPILARAAHVMLASHVTLFFPLAIPSVPLVGCMWDNPTRTSPASKLQYSLEATFCLVLLTLHIIRGEYNRSYNQMRACGSKPSR